MRDRPLVPVRALMRITANVVLVLLTVGLTAAVDAAIRAGMSETSEAAQQPWAQYQFGMTFLTVASPIFLGIPLAVLNLVLAQSAHPRRLAIVVTTVLGVALAGITMMGGNGGIRELVFLGATGVLSGAVILLPPRRQA